MLIETHVIKNYGPANLNRDDNGAPKTCYFGGVKRGRISSQCLKSHWRNSEEFQKEVGETNIGIRTRHLADYVIANMTNDGVDTIICELIAPTISSIISGDTKKPNLTNQIVFYSAKDIKAVTNAVENAISSFDTDEVVKMLKKFNAKKEKDADKDKETKGDILAKIKENLKHEHFGVSLDMALFGRMVTNDTFKNVEAAMQVSHAISTHKVIDEADYFTAVDDFLSTGNMEEQGSAMLGDIDYNSCCYYMYAALDTDILKKNLNDNEDADEIIKNAIPSLIKIMAEINPSGKQNSFASHSLPSAVMVEIKDNKIPCDYKNAFDKAVSSTHGDGYISQSVEKLVAYAQKIDSKFQIPIKKRFWLSMEDITLDSNFAVNCNNMNDMLNGVKEVIA